MKDEAKQMQKRIRRVVNAATNQVGAMILEKEIGPITASKLLRDIAIVEDFAAKAAKDLGDLLTDLDKEAQGIEQIPARN